VHTFNQKPKPLLEKDITVCSDIFLHGYAGNLNAIAKSQDMLKYSGMLFDAQMEW